MRANSQLLDPYVIINKEKFGKKKKKKKGKDKKKM